MCQRKESRIIQGTILAALRSCEIEEREGGVDALNLESMKVEIVFQYSDGTKICSSPELRFGTCDCDRPACVVHKVMKE